MKNMYLRHLSAIHLFVAYQRSIMQFCFSTFFEINISFFVFILYIRSQQMALEFEKSALYTKERQYDRVYSPINERKPQDNSQDINEAPSCI